MKWELGKRSKPRDFQSNLGLATPGEKVLRRELGIPVDATSLLKNIEFWDYWSSPGLNTQLLENNTIRVIIRSVGFGWIWYIALKIPVLVRDGFRLQLTGTYDLALNAMVDEH